MVERAQSDDQRFHGMMAPAVLPLPFLVSLAPGEFKLRCEFHPTDSTGIIKVEQPA